MFALLATLIPSLTMGWLSYVENTKVMTEKVTEELQVASSQTARELDIWIKQRVYELRVFSSSYEVSENLQKSIDGRASPEAHQRLNAYVKSVSEKFAVYEELMVIDAEGRVVTTSAAEAGTVNLPADWLFQARAGEPIMGSAYWDNLNEKTAVTVAVPIKTADDQLLGLLAAKLNFHSIETLMQSFAPRDAGQMYLIDMDGKLITSSQGASPALGDARLSASVTQAMMERSTLPLEYASLRDKPALGSIAFLSQWELGVLAEIGKAEAYAKTIRVRNLTLLITLAVLLVVGMSAYVLGVTIVRPLYRLSKGANQVANGNLSVEVPVVGGGEVGYLTEVFNSMVGKLRAGQDELAAINDTLVKTNRELQELSITDSLTGLYNRRYLMDTLSSEVARAERMGRELSVLMIDIDYFKKYNDTYGHMAGDDLLVKVSSFFKGAIRSMDFAARYGGEEFLIVLPEHGAKPAVDVAERIRKTLAAAIRDDEDSKEPVTISIGVAAFPDYGVTPAALIASADAALYLGKEGGRNRVVLADAIPAAVTAGRKRSARTGR